MNFIQFGDCRETMRAWSLMGFPKARMCVTSPPYFGLRDYGHAGQLGLEQTPREYIAAMVDVFRAVRDCLTDDGTLWLNIGDSYVGSANNGGQASKTMRGPQAATGTSLPSKRGEGLKPKDLIGIPWMLAFALREDGWYLRQDIIWHKPNPMPESVTDRCTKAHEYLFLLSKSSRYYFDSDAMQEPAVSTHRPGNVSTPKAVEADPEKHRTRAGLLAYAARSRGGANAFRGQGHMRDGAGPANPVGRDMSTVGIGETRNRRSVWTVATRPYKGAHFATFPPELITPCVLAGSEPDDIVLDPFMGSGTTAAVAVAHGRQYLGCELNPAYEPLQRERLA